MRENKDMRTATMTDASAANDRGAAPVSGQITEQLNKAGLAVVPKTPTPRMLEAGRLAGNGDPALAKAIFAAMMDAAN